VPSALLFTGLNFNNGLIVAGYCDVFFYELVRLVDTPDLINMAQYAARRIVEAACNDPDTY